METPIHVNKVFSFCLYGSDDNYYTGLLENIEIIKQYYPDFEIYVYKGICEKEWPIEGATVISTEREGAVNMLYRYLPLKFAQIGFVRDTDSRITERDRWCIDDFLKSDKDYHIIRDHFWHKSKIMGGLFGWKVPLDICFDLSVDFGYSVDEAVLEQVLYPRLRSRILVHTNICSYHGEEDRRIACERSSPTDFIGNVIWNGVPKFHYFLDNVDQLTFLQGQDKFELMKYLSDGVDIFTIPYPRRKQFLDAAYIANFYLNDNAMSQYWLRQYEFAEFNEHTIINSEFLIPKLNKKVVASFDSTRKANDDEIVFIYGNYPIWYLSLPGQNEVFRHVSMFYRIKHDLVEYHPCWEKIDVIYILNLEDRKDRYYETLNALVSVRAPLHRVYHYKAKKAAEDPYIGASQNHIDVMKHFQESDYNHCMILEDDFVFLDLKELVWSSMNEYFSREYDVDICFLSISKDGHREPHDNLLSKSLQGCTTSSGYLLNKKTSERVFEVASEGVQLMREKQDHNGCIDRYWTRLPNIYFFKTKLGFQRPAYSNLRQEVIAHLD